MWADLRLSAWTFSAINALIVYGDRKGKPCTATVLLQSEDSAHPLNHLATLLRSSQNDSKVGLWNVNSFIEGLCRTDRGEPTGSEFLEHNSPLFSLQTGVERLGGNVVMAEFPGGVLGGLDCF